MRQYPDPAERGSYRLRIIRPSDRKPLVRWYLWFAPLTFLGLFFFYPLTRILAISLDITAITQDNLRQAASVLIFTIYQAALSTLLTLLLGLPSAWLFARFSFRGKGILHAITAVPFMLPTVVVAAGFNALVGPRGWINLLLTDWFGIERPPIAFIGSLGAILVAHVFYNTTIVIRITGAALAGLDPRMEQAAHSLGANDHQTWMHVVLPLLKPSILAATLLVFLFDFTSFGVILLLGGPQFSTLEVEIFKQAIQRLNLPFAGILALIQLICTLVVSILYTDWFSRTTRQISPRADIYNERKPKNFREALFIGGLCVALLIFYLSPLVSLSFRSVARLEAERGQRGTPKYGLTLDYYEELFINRHGSLFFVPPIQAATNSLLYAGATVLLSLLLGFPAAIALANPTRFEKLIDPAVMLPLGASAVSLGLGFIMAYGSWLASPVLVPVAHTLIALPFVIRTLQPAIASIPNRLRQAAALLGAEPFQVWKSVDWPILVQAILAAATFAFTVSLGEFGAALLITRPEYPTVPVAIYRFLSQPGSLNYGQAMAMATLLMVMTLLGILLIERMRIEGVKEF